MPDGRFLSKTIAHDFELNTVSIEADYLFTRCIPHLDREGRMPGHPSQVKGITCPMRAELSEMVIDQALEELARAGLVVWYEVEGRPYLEFPGFTPHQKGMRKDREAESRIPSPKVHAAQRITTVLRRDSGPTPEQVGSTPDLLRPSEVKSSQVKLREEGYQPPATPQASGKGDEATHPDALPARHEGHEREEKISAQEAKRLRDADRDVILDDLHLGKPVVIVNGKPVSMELEMHIHDALVRQWGARGVHAALPRIRAVEEIPDDEPISLRLVEAHPEVMTRALAAAALDESPPGPSAAELGVTVKTIPQEKARTA